MDVSGPNSDPRSDKIDGTVAANMVNGPAYLAKKTHLKRYSAAGPNGTQSEREGLAALQLRPGYKGKSCSLSPAFPPEDENPDNRDVQSAPQMG